MASEHLAGPGCSLSEGFTALRPHIGTVDVINAEYVYCKRWEIGIIQ